MKDKGKGPGQHSDGSAVFHPILLAKGVPTPCQHKLLWCPLGPVPVQSRRARASLNSCDESVFVSTTKTRKENHPTDALKAWGGPTRSSVDKLGPGNSSWA